MKKYYSTITYTTLSLLLTLCLLSTPVKAQQETMPGNMPAPQEMMMKQMALRTHQYQGNSNREELKDSPQNINRPQNHMMKMMGSSIGPMAKGGMMGANRSQMRSMMMSSGMGPGMMQGNMMMGYPMMGFANGQELDYLVAYERFINETREMRRTLQNKRFDFKEAFWIPETTLQELRDMAQEINLLQQELDAKRPTPQSEKE